MNKTNVLQLIDSLDLGGAETLAVNTYNLLAKEMYCNSFICATRLEGPLKKRLDSDDNYLFLKKTGSIDFRAIVRLKKFVQKKQIQIIHAHSSSFFLAVCVKILYPKLKIIWHDHYGKSEFLQNRKKTALKIASPFFSSIISINNILKTWAQNNLHCSYVNHVNNYAELDPFEKTTILSGIEGKRIVCLAALRPQKDHLNLLKAFTKLHKNYSDWSLHLVGEGHDIEYLAKIKEFISTNQLEKNVFLYGGCLDINSILQQATIGVLSSKSEGLPIALLEYGLAKLPVLVTDVGDCYKLTKRLHPNLRVSPENNQEFYKQLKTLIDFTDETRERMGSKLLEIVGKEYSAENYIKELINIYKKCL